MEIDMKTYTFYFNWCDTLYVYQFKANDELDALEVWINSIDVSRIKNMGEGFKDQALRDIKDREVVSPEGMKNAYVMSFLYRGKLGMLDFVKTDLT